MAWPSRNIIFQTDHTGANCVRMGPPGTLDSMNTTKVELAFGTTASLMGTHANTSCCEQLAHCTFPAYPKASWM